jgi:signal transduction histidine kinase
MILSSRNVARASIAFLIVGFVALITIVGITISLSERARVYFEEAVADRDIRVAAVEMRHAVLTAETSQRGYLVTGNQIYLAPYGNAKATALRELGTLKLRLESSIEMQPALAKLSTIIDDKFTEMDTSIATKRERRDDEVLAILRTNRGKALMDTANVFFAGIIRAADERFAAGAIEQQANAANLRLSSIIGGIIIVTVVGGATFNNFRFTRELLAARNDLDSLNAGLERRVKDRTAELGQLNDELQRFAYVVTHDLRAPLVNIMGFTSELERGVASMKALIDRSDAPADKSDAVAMDARTAAAEDLPEAINFIRSSTRKMDGLINAILKLSREGRRTLRAEPIMLRELVETSADTIQHQLAEADGSIRIDLGVASVTADRLVLEQILGNLFDNAVKYRSPDRPLAIVVRAEPADRDRVVIEVGDNGRGIAESDRERIFELFRRAGPQNQSGEGIGLAHVRAMVRNMGGEITVHSELGKGTTFRIVLPREAKIEGKRPA